MDSLPSVEAITFLRSPTCLRYHPVTVVTSREPARLDQEVFQGALMASLLSVEYGIVAVVSKAFRMAYKSG